MQVRIWWRVFMSPVVQFPIMIFFYIFCFKRFRNISHFSIILSFFQTIWTTPVLLFLSRSYLFLSWERTSIVSFSHPSNRMLKTDTKYGIFAICTTQWESRLFPASSRGLGVKNYMTSIASYIVCKWEKRHVVKSYCYYLLGWG